LITIRPPSGKTQVRQISVELLEDLLQLAPVAAPSSRGVISTTCERLPASRRFPRER
jgi:hypothetical protein